MKKKVIYELNIDSKHSLLVCEKKNYDDCYYTNCILYLRNGHRKKKFAQGSFCYGIGLSMYYRFYNVKELNELSDFKAGIVESFNSMDYDKVPDPSDRNPDDGYVKYYFMNGDRDRELFFGRKGENYLLICAKLDTEPKKCRIKILKVYSINETTFAEWKKIACEEWEKRVRREEERDYGKNKSDEEWQKYYVFMRTDD